jgi:hypothetical protein
MPQVEPANAIERLDGLLVWLRNEIEELVPLTHGQRVHLAIMIEAIQDKMDEVLADK